MKDYNEQKDKAGFDLKQFVIDNFIIPGTHNDVFKKRCTGGIRKHIDTLWHVLYRKHDTVSRYSSLLPVPNDFVVPGGRFAKPITGTPTLPCWACRRVTKRRSSIIWWATFAYLLDKYGFIPNGIRTYYLTRSQPPFFSMMLDVLAKDEGEKVITQYQPELLKEYEFWMIGAGKLKPGQAYRNAVRMPGGEIMNRYWDASDKPREESYKKDITAAKDTKQKPEIFIVTSAPRPSLAGILVPGGWILPANWKVYNTLIVPVDLNCLIYHLELSIAKSYKLQNNGVKYRSYLTKSHASQKAIQNIAGAPAKAGLWITTGKPGTLRLHSRLRALSRWSLNTYRTTGRSYGQSAEDQIS